MEIIRKKQIKSILNKVAANYLIGIDALKKADMEAKDFVDAENHLSDNTIDIAKSLDGMRGVNFVNDFVKRYGQNLF
jgi:hypothetical protein